MVWRVKYHKRAVRFLQSLDEGTRRRVLDRIDELKDALNEGKFPLLEASDKEVKGELGGLLQDEGRQDKGDLQA